MWHWSEKLKTDGDGVIERYVKNLLHGRILAEKEEEINSNPLVSVAIRPPKMAETKTRLSPALLQKHSIGGCTINVGGAYHFITQYLVTMQCGNVWCRRVLVRQYGGWRARTTLIRSPITSRTSISTSSTASSGSSTATTTCWSVRRTSVDITITVQNPCCRNNNNNTHICIVPYRRNFRGAVAREWASESKKREESKSGRKGMSLA